MAFGGAYAWTLPPTYLLLGAAVIASRPRPAPGPDRALDLALAAAIAAAAFQLVPLAPSVRAVLSPHAVAFDEALRFDPAGTYRPLTLDPAATLTWLPAGSAAVVLFWAARQSLTTTTVRHLARAIAWIGLAIGPLAIVQHYSSPNLLYWTFRPIDAGAATAGPFVNRNHMATWLLLALPTTVGYLVAHGAAHADGRPRIAAAAKMLEEPRLFWLTAAAVAMFAALITTQSRSGFIGLAAALGTGLLVPRVTGRQVHLRVASLIVVAALGVAIAVANTGGLMSRFEKIGTDPAGGRVAIWRQTLPIVRDFAITGVGVGAYRTAMLAYREQNRYEFFYNQAHDQYLQFAAEGGLLVGIPIVFAMIAFARAASRAVAYDHSAIFWIRTGACAALAGVAVQSIWETGLRMPANALLCAAIAGIAVHPLHVRGQVIQPPQRARANDAA